MRKGPAKCNFLVDDRAADTSDGEASENISPNAVIADQLRRSHFQRNRSTNFHQPDLAASPCFLV